MGRLRDLPDFAQLVGSRAKINPSPEHQHHDPELIQVSITLAAELMPGHS